jgi:hypothetical protein
VGAHASMPAPEPKARAARRREPASKPDQAEVEDRAPSLEERASSHAAGLRWARERGLRALERDERDGVKADWREELLPAAQQILGALEQFGDDEELWDALKAREFNVAVLDDQRRLQMQEVFDQDLAALLVYMGYRPPPAAQRLETDLKEALADMLESSTNDAMRAVRTRRAESNLAIFTIRLRRVVSAAEQQRTDEPDGGQSRSEAGSVRASLRSALRQGVAVAVPAALAAAAVAAVFPPAGAAAGAVGFTVAASAFGQELLKQSIQLGGTGLLDQVLAREMATADSVERFNAAWQRTWIAMQDLVSTISTLCRDPSHALRRVRAKALCIESLSSLYGFLQAELDVDPIAHHALRAAAEDLFVSLYDAQEMIEASTSGEELSRLARGLSAKTDELYDVLKKTWGS